MIDALKLINDNNFIYIHSKNVTDVISSITSQYLDYLKVGDLNCPYRLSIIELIYQRFFIRGERNWHHIPGALHEKLNHYYNPHDYSINPSTNPSFSIEIEVGPVDSNKLEYLWRIYADKIRNSGQLKLNEGWKNIFTCGTIKSGLIMILDYLILDMNSLLGMEQETLSHYDNYQGEASKEIKFSEILDQVFKNQAAYLIK